MGSEVLVMCGSFGLSVMTMRVGQRTYEIAQDIEGVGAQERQITTLRGVWRFRTTLTKLD